MPRILLIFSICIIVSAPFSAVASSCSDEGFTVVYVNGILTSLETAESNADKLQKTIGYSIGSEAVTVRLSHNLSHLAGVADAAQSIAQTFDSSISNYDRNTILMEIHPQVTTRKILLVGHSQGTFYTNEIYRYFLEHGTSEGSTAVYNLATPAYYVAGGGSYLTSSNDKAILEIRAHDRRIGARFSTSRKYRHPDAAGGGERTLGRTPPFD